MAKTNRDWDVLSELRLFKNIVNHKPAGITSHFQMICLTQFLNTISAHEDDVQDFLSEEDYDKLIEEENNTGGATVSMEFQVNSFKKFK